MHMKKKRRSREKRVRDGGVGRVQKEEMRGGARLLKGQGHGSESARGDPELERAERARASRGSERRLREQEKEEEQEEEDKEKKSSSDRDENYIVVLRDFQSIRHSTRIPMGWCGSRKTVLTLD